ncbi:MAG TPA: mannose-6-phosphate isomerase, partial [Thermosipho africanus]|nr:mannose-6-phosphate isomerase [Thermosipho africanus]
MIKIEPKFREQVWGDFNLNKTFGIKGNPIGEVWLLSGHPLYTTNVNGKTVNEESKELCGKNF